jgi:hypothetical protein
MQKKRHFRLVIEGCGLIKEGAGWCLENINEGNTKEILARRIGNF